MFCIIVTVVLLPLTSSLLASNDNIQTEDDRERWQDVHQSQAVQPRNVIVSPSIIPNKNNLLSGSRKIIWKRNTIGNLRLHRSKRWVDVDDEAPEPKERSKGEVRGNNHSPYDALTKLVGDFDKDIPTKVSAVNDITNLQSAEDSLSGGKSSADLHQSPLTYFPQPAQQTIEHMHTTDNEFPSLSHYSPLKARTLGFPPLEAYASPLTANEAHYMPVGSPHQNIPEDTSYIPIAKATPEGYTNALEKLYSRQLGNDVSGTRRTVFTSMNENGASQEGNRRPVTLAGSPEERAMMREAENEYFNKLHLRSEATNQVGMLPVAPISSAPQSIVLREPTPRPEGGRVIDISKIDMSKIDTSRLMKPIAVNQIPIEVFAGRPRHHHHPQVFMLGTPHHHHHHHHHHRHDMDEDIQEVDESAAVCHKGECKNGGNCNLVDGSKHCSCARGYRGVNCEDVSLCHPDPCKHGGTCSETDTGYVCTCPPIAIGEHCETLSHCHPNPCRNNGYCYETGNTFACSCAYGFKGGTCALSSFCHATNPCLNNGICSEDDSNYKCSCARGFTGTNCESKRTTCLASTCQNGGTCTDEGGQIHCGCPEEFRGRFCEEKVFRPCNAATCLFGGSCIEINQYEYQCLCPPGRTGKRCSAILEDPCSHCHTNAKCTENGVINGCVCRDGFMGNGLYCERVPSKCHPNPCENGGTCVDKYYYLDEGDHNTNANSFTSDVAEQSRTRVDPRLDPSKFSVENGIPASTLNPDAMREDDLASPRGVQNQFPLDGSFKATFGSPNDVNFRKKLKVMVKKDVLPHFASNGSLGNTSSYIQLTKRSAENEISKRFEIARNIFDDFIDEEEKSSFSGKSMEMGNKRQLPFYLRYRRDDEIVPLNVDKNALNFNGYACACTRGFKGQDCQDTEPCHPNPCRNGGICTEFNDMPTCDCVHPYVGTMCNMTNSCVPDNPCMNGASCTDDNGMATCFCKPRFHGGRCESDKCGKCSAYATCTSKGMCRCKMGYIGNGYICEEDKGIDQCGKCSPYATCSRGICRCKIGHIGNGYICEQDSKRSSDPCHPNPCRYGGTCARKADGSPRCYCSRTNYGKYCEQKQPVFNPVQRQEFMRLPLPNNNFNTNNNNNYNNYNNRNNDNDGSQIINNFYKQNNRNGDQQNNMNNVNNNNPINYNNFNRINDNINNENKNDKGMVAISKDTGVKDVVKPSDSEVEQKQPTTSSNNQFCHPNPCLNDGTCINEENTYVCKCLSQYLGAHCEEDKCVKCHVQATCNEGQCTCRDGYHGDGHNCEKNPCDGGCPPNSTCQDEVCVCNSGFVRDGDLCTQDFCGNKCVDNSVCKHGHCVCIPGYYKDGPICKRNLCDHKCPEHSECIRGECKCKPGFVKDEESNCKKSLCEHECPPHSECDINGVCFCHQGYFKQNDECVLSACQQECPPHSKCDGGFCVCDPGYTKDGDSKCKDSASSVREEPGAALTVIDSSPKDKSPTPHHTASTLRKTTRNYSGRNVTSVPMLVDAPDKTLSAAPQNFIKGKNHPTSEMHQRVVVIDHHNMIISNYLNSNPHPSLSSNRNAPTVVDRESKPVKGIKSKKESKLIQYPSPAVVPPVEPKSKPSKPVRYPSPDDFRKTHKLGVKPTERVRVKYPDPEILQQHSENKEDNIDVKNVKYPPPDLPLIPAANVAHKPPSSVVLADNKELPSSLVALVQKTINERISTKANELKALGLPNKVVSALLSTINAKKSAARPKEDLVISVYKNMGCWKDTEYWWDPSRRAIPTIERLSGRLLDDYKVRKDPIGKCADSAKDLGFKIFAIQNGGQCFTSANAGLFFRKYGKSDKCINGLGGPLAYDVYST